MDGGRGVGLGVDGGDPSHCSFCKLQVKSFFKRNCPSQSSTACT